VRWVVSCGVVSVGLGASIDLGGVWAWFVCTRMVKVNLALAGGVRNTYNIDRPTHGSHPNFLHTNREHEAAHHGLG
jgi:hypothetical protein